MLTRKQLIEQLDAMRGRGQWRLIAAEAACDYNTLARIARGEQMPRADLLERLSVAVEARKAKPRRKAETV